MIRGLIAAVSFLIGFSSVSPAFSDEESEISEKIGCFTGPAVKTFGYTNWNVYSCGDPNSIAIVSAPGSPAMPFYFMIFKKDGKYRLVGEGTGDREATSAAANYLRKLIESEAEINALIEETIAAEEKSE